MRNYRDELNKANNLDTDYEFPSFVKAAVEYAPRDARSQYHFVDGAEWQRDEIMPDLKFILEALPIEASIADPKIRSEIDLVRNKVNEIIAKIQ